MILTSIKDVRDVQEKRDKAYLLDKISEKSDVNKNILIMMFDEDIRFYADTNKIKKILDCSMPPLIYKDEEELNYELLHLLEILASQEVRGDQAHNLCADFAEQLESQDEINIFLDILNNKLRLGMKATGVNKYCKTFKIDQYEVMFAAKWKDCKPDWHNQWMLQPKIDGNRCINEYRGKSEFLSRTGKAFTSLKLLENEFNKIGRNSQFVLDGEIENGTLEETGAIRRQSEQADNAIYTIFGIYNLGEWETKKHITCYNSVYKQTKEFLDKHNFHNVRLIPSYTIQADSEEEFHSLIQKYTEEFILQGYEGSVLKSVDHVYQPSAGTKRSKDWIKIKPIEKSIDHCVLDTDGLILDIIESDSLERGLIGKFVVKWATETFECAPGNFTHDQQKEILKNKDKYIDNKLEFRFQCFSKYGIPRHAFASKIHSRIDR